MARIRTIKPEFPQSESMGRCSRDGRLLFIQLWTLADDSGRLRGNSRMLASLLYPYDDDAPRLLPGWLSELEQEGCVISYEVDGNSYIQICNWLNHQKIDKPSQSKIPEVANPRESSRILALGSKDLRIKDQGSEDLRIKEGNGRDHGKNRGASLAAGKETDIQESCKKTWSAYSDAYFNRYGTEPVRNAKVNSCVKQLVSRLGAEESPLVAAYFVLHNDAFYVKKGHDFSILLADAEKVRMEWATNRTVTGTKARQLEKSSATYDAVQEIINERGMA